MMPTSPPGPVTPRLRTAAERFVTLAIGYIECLSLPVVTRDGRTCLRSTTGDGCLYLQRDLGWADPPIHCVGQLRYFPLTAEGQAAREDLLRLHPHPEGYARGTGDDGILSMREVEALRSRCRDILAGKPVTIRRDPEIAVLDEHIRASHPSPATRRRWGLASEVFPTGLGDLDGTVERGTERFPRRNG